MQLDRADLGIELRELLESIERPVRPSREGRADLRLERVVLREQRCRRVGVTPLIERRPS